MDEGDLHFDDFLRAARQHFAEDGTGLLKVAGASQRIAVAAEQESIAALDADGAFKFSDGFRQRTFAGQRAGRPVT